MVDLEVEEAMGAAVQQLGPRLQLVIVVPVVLLEMLGPQQHPLMPDNSADHHASVPRGAGMVVVADAQFIELQMQLIELAHTQGNHLLPAGLRQIAIGRQYAEIGAFSGGQQIQLLALAGPQLQLLRSEEHTSELQSRENLVCRLLLEK